MEAPINPSERRAFERFPSRFPTRFKDTRQDYGTNVVLRDACAQGARIITREKLAPHDYVDLEIKLPDGADPLHLQGEVVWTKNMEPNIWDVGIQFPAVHFMHLARLYKFA